MILQRERKTKKRNLSFGENTGKPVKFRPALKNFFAWKVPGTIAPEFVPSFHRYVNTLKSTVVHIHIHIPQIYIHTLERKLARRSMERIHWIPDRIRRESDDDEKCFLLHIVIVIVVVMSGWNRALCKIASSQIYCVFRKKEICLTHLVFQKTKSHCACTLKEGCSNVGA